MINLKKLLTEAFGKKGNCFDAAYDYVTRENPKALLVHGFVSGQGPLEGYRYAHAWNEYKNDVIDNSNGRNIKLPKTKYYQLGKIDERECKYYDFKAVMDMSIEHRHKGPWEIKNTHFKENTTSAGGEYATPHAFSKSKKQKKKGAPRKWSYVEPSLMSSSSKDLNERNLTGTEKLRKLIERLIARELRKISNN